MTGFAEWTVDGKQEMMRIHLMIPDTLIRLTQQTGKLVFSE